MRPYNPKASAKISINIIPTKILSKSNSKAAVNSSKGNINLKNSKSDKDTSNENTSYDNIYINMMDEQNISYLWYMEAKKKNNKSINYSVNEYYDELFEDFIDNSNNIPPEKKN